MSAIFALDDIIVRLNAQKIKLFLVLENTEVYNQIKALDNVILDKNCIFKDENEAILLAKDEMNKE